MTARIDVFSPRWMPWVLGILLTGCPRRSPSPSGQLQIRPPKVQATTPVQALLRISGPTPDSVRVIWFRNGKPVGTGPRLSPGRVRRGDTLQALALIFRQTKGESLWSAAVMVENSPPVIRSLQVHPDPPHPDSALRAEVRVWDPDGDPVQRRFLWIVEGREVGRDSILPPGSFRGGDRVVLWVTPQDPVESGTPATYEGVALNRPPRFTATQRPTRRGDTLWIPFHVEDPDGDSLTLKLVEAPPEFQLDPRRRMVWGVLRGGGVIRIEAQDPHGGRAWYRVDLEEVR